MRKKWFCVLLVAVFAVSMVSIGMVQQAAAQKVIKWKLQSHWPASSASFKPMKDFFEQDMVKLTDGRLQVAVHPAGALVPSKDIFGATRKGMVELATAAPIYWMSQIPIAAVAANCPMTFRSTKEGLDFHFKHGFEKMLKDAHAKHGLLYYTERIYPTALISKRPITKIEDFKGYKVRSSGAIADMLKELGASPVLIPGEEIYLSLQTGVIHGAHWGAASGALTMKFCEVAKYYIQPDLAMAGTDVIVINKEAFEALPKDIQQILDKTLNERVFKRTEEYEKEEKASLEKMIKEYNVTVSTVVPADQKKMMAAAMKQWDIVASKDADSAKAIAMLKKYLKDLGHID
jgi:TRAP-type mannitol/chloroaromatic compound transport system substrate-binding protein